MKHPFRFWMTSCVAVVMASLGGGRALANERHPLTQSSRYRVTETMERIEACAHKHGLSVFTRMARKASQRPGESGEFALIVFESASLDGTPVLMEGPESRPVVPLTVYVRSDEAGETEVLFTGTDWAGLPADVSRSLTELPMLVADALQ
jgi:uncharacterized protein (DUF302 family)